MSKSVHYLPVGLGRQHLTQPLLRGPYPVTDVTLLVPANQQIPLGMVEETRAHLEDGLDLKLEVKEVRTEEFASVVATGYDDIFKTASKTTDIYVNAASSPWNLGAGYATAASFILREAPYRDWDQHISTDPRDTITLYYTEPAAYDIDALLDIARKAVDLRGEFQEFRSETAELREEVETDVDTARGIVDKLEEDGQSLESAFEWLWNFLETADEGSIADGISDIFDGVDSIVNGINTLTRPENKENLQTVKKIGEGGTIGNVIKGLEDFGGRTESEEGQISTLDLLTYILQRLESVDEVLQSVERRSKNIEDEFDRSAPELEDFFDNVRHRGVAHGHRKFDGQALVELPGPMEFDLREYQRAVIYTLATGGKAESLKELIARVAHHALAVADGDSQELSSNEAVELLRSGDIDPSAAIIEDYISPKIRSGIQTNVTDLENSGVVRKGQIGRSTTVELSRAGEVYARTQTFDNAWRQAAFDQLSDNVSSVVEKYAEDHSQ